jgi:glycosyltransferase involved in cell wall biosynthesis
MKNVPSNRALPAISAEIRDEIDRRWNGALSFFKSRKKVIFISYCRFWERHAFVQQSLAKLLVNNGVEVVWLDGSGWRPYRPTLYFKSPLLTVSQLWELPGRRLSAVASFNVELQYRQIKKIRGGSKIRPVLWAQGGINENLVDLLPYVDVFSTFDDPLRHSADGPLCQKARLILCQNSEALNLLKTVNHKTLLSFPPVDMDEIRFGKSEEFRLPPDFPTRRMGYVGSFFGKDYDLVLLEHLVRTLPKVGFILAGRSDTEGERAVKFLSQYPNFVAYRWVPRESIAPIWKSLNVGLLLYRPVPEQSGAFPTKVIEAAYFGVPCVATKVPKTQDLEGMFPRTSLPDEIVQIAAKLAEGSEQDLQKIYSRLYVDLHPKLHLSRVAERLRAS